MEIIERYPALHECKNDIIKACDMIIDCYSNNGKLLLCGNGGSAADCEHISGELMKSFLKKRMLSDFQKQEMKKSSPLIDDDTLNGIQGGLPAIPLSALSGFNSAVCNDGDSSLVYAQGVMALGKSNDVLLALSTSGNSENVLKAAMTAKGIGMKVIALTGKGGGKLRDVCDVAVCVPESETYKIQELHLPTYHYLCAVVEEHFFK